jgi:hypothetical protein
MEKANFMKNEDWKDGLHGWWIQILGQVSFNNKHSTTKIKMPFSHFSVPSPPSCGQAPSKGPDRQGLVD